MTDVTEAVDNDFEVIPNQQQRGQADGDTSRVSTNEKDNTRENNVAKIKVVVYTFFLYACICLKLLGVSTL